MTTLDDAEALRLCIRLARESLETGDVPFGTVLVDASGKLLREDRDRTVSGEGSDYKPDATMHSGFLIARWAQMNLSDEERASATVYTTGEHCPMCASAHVLVGLGRIVFAASTAQYLSWMEELSVERGIVSALTIAEVMPQIKTEGPIQPYDRQVKSLFKEKWLREKGGR